MKLRGIAREHCLLFTLPSQDTRWLLASERFSRELGLGPLIQDLPFQGGCRIPSVASSAPEGVGLELTFHHIYSIIWRTPPMNMEGC